MSGAMLEPLQQALYGVLSGDATLSAISGVYDRVPEGTALPLVAFGDAATQDASTVSAEGERLSLDVLVYSREGGRKEALEIMQRIHSLLHQQSPTLSGGYRLVWMRVQRVGVGLQRDGMTWQGTMQVQALAETAG